MIDLIKRHDRTAFSAFLWRFERSTKVAYFQQLRSVSPIALQFTSWKPYAESCVSEGTKDPIERLFQLIFYESFYMFITSGLLHFCCFQTLENLVVVQPSLPVCGKRGCLCNKHNSCWSLAYSGWKSLAWAHGSWWCCPSGLLAASSSWSTCHGGQDGAPPVPRAWDWCEEIERGVGMTTMALLWPLGCRVFLGLL